MEQKKKIKKGDTCVVVKCPFCDYQKQFKVYPVHLMYKLWKVECDKCHKYFGVTFALN